MEMNEYNCSNPNKIHIPSRMKSKFEKPKEAKIDLIQKFKSDPNSFFSSIIPPVKPK